MSDLAECAGCSKEFDLNDKQAVGYCGCGLCESGNSQMGDPLFCTVKCHDSYYAGLGDYLADQAADRHTDDQQIEKAEREGQL